MKQTPERIEALAAEYVLGSLQGAARRRFERWMVGSSAVRQEVRFWEERLGELSTALPEQAPPASVWQGVSRRLWPSRERSAASVPVARTQAQGVSGWARWFWPGWSLAATAAAVVLALLLGVNPGTRDTGAELALSGAVVQPDVDDPLWLVSETANQNQLRLRPVAATAANPGKDYELWVVPETGAPLSLGVLTVGNVTVIPLDDRLRKVLASSRTLAISLEPRGGSPTGAPTGPILHVAKLYSL